MQDGRISKTRKGDREIISISLPLSVYDVMKDVCDHYNMNRSSMITNAVIDYLKKVGVKIGER